MLRRLPENGLTRNDGPRNPKEPKRREFGGRWRFPSPFSCILNFNRVLLRLFLSFEANVVEMKVLRKELKKKSELWQSLLASQVLKVELNLVVIYWYMARERKNPQSRWTPYLDILPETYTTPIYWTKEELAEIEGTNLHGKFF